MFGTQHFTTNIYFKELSKLYDHLQQICDEATGLLYGMAMRMKFKYNKYWDDIEKDNRLLFVVTILNLQY